MAIRSSGFRKPVKLGVRKRRRITNAQLVRFGSSRSRKTSKKVVTAGSECPVKSTPECFAWKPLDQTPETVGMTAEQMKAAHVVRDHHLYWCSECRNLWINDDHSFVRVIGSWENTGHPFIPETSRFRSIYIGSR
jgi:hypothetical protein